MISLGYLLTFLKMEPKDISQPNSWNFKIPWSLIVTDHLSYLYKILTSFNDVAALNF